LPCRLPCCFSARLPTSSTSTIFLLEQAQLWCYWE